MLIRLKLRSSSGAVSALAVLLAVAASLTVACTGTTEAEDFPATGELTAEQEANQVQGSLPAESVEVDTGTGLTTMPNPHHHTVMCWLGEPCWDCDFPEVFVIPTVDRRDRDAPGVSVPGADSAWWATQDDVIALVPEASLEEVRVVRWGGDLWRP